MGGIGKTRLSRQCEIIANSGLIPNANPLTFRIDFDDPSFLDPETLLLSVRSTVGSVHGVRTLAFDLALGAYWAMKHPGEPIRSFLDRSGWLSRVTRNDRVSHDISASIEDLLSLSSTAAASIRIGARLIAALQRKANTRKLLADCPLLEEILNNEDVNDVRLFLPYLMAWDLSQLDDNHRLALTIFADTFEDVQEKSTGQRDIEDVFSRMVYLMPNVLFVVTGRHRLRWASPAMAEQLLFYGADRWPGLADESSSRSQYLLGRLSARDSETYLEARIGPPQVDHRLIRRIVDASDGWPLYLDLQATRVRRLRARSAVIQASEFGGPLVEVVVRIMRDLDQWDRSLLRASSLVATVNEKILKAAVPEVLESQIAQFLDMSLLARPDGQRGLNRALSDSIFEADKDLNDRWSADHWRVVADRLLTYFEVVADQDDPALLTSAYLESFELGARFGISPQWLPRVAESLFAHGLWQVLQTPLRSANVRASSLEPVAQASTAAALRATSGTAASAILAERLVASLPKLDGELQNYVAWQVVASAERSGDHAMASRISSSIVTPAFRARALVRLGRLAWIAGNLSEALELASAADAELTTAIASNGKLSRILQTVAITQRSLMGWIRFTQGRFADAEHQFREALAEAQRQASEFFTVSEEAHLALTLAISASPSSSGGRWISSDCMRKPGIEPSACSNAHRRSNAEHSRAPRGRSTSRA